MKKIITLSLLSVLMAFCATSISAQKFGFVDSEYILAKIPKYKTAQGELDKISENWRKEVDGKRAAIEKMYNEYQAQEVLLSEAMRKQRQDQIFNKEKELQEFQQKKFGYEGELFQKRQELVQPIQTEIFEATQKIAKNRGLDFVFDKSTVTMLVSNARFDLSDDVLKAMGL